MKTLLVLAVVLGVLVTAGCAAHPNPLSGAAGPEGKVAGFWLGLWQGFIVLFTFIISLFSDQVTVYEVHNNGNLYNLGFVLGILIFFGGSGRGSGSRKGGRLSRR